MTVLPVGFDMKIVLFVRGVVRIMDKCLLTACILTTDVKLAKGSLSLRAQQQSAVPALLP